MHLLFSHRNVLSHSQGIDFFGTQHRNGMHWAVDSRFPSNDKVSPRLWPSFSLVHQYQPRRTHSHSVIHTRSWFLIFLFKSHVLRLFPTRYVFTLQLACPWQMA